MTRVKEELDDTKNTLKTQVKLTEDLQKERVNVWQENVQLNNQRDCLIQELERMSVLIAKMVHGELQEVGRQYWWNKTKKDFEENLQAAEEREWEFQNELDASKGLIYKYIQEIRELKQVIVSLYSSKKEQKVGLIFILEYKQSIF